MRTTKILFVCRWNRFRSKYAEAIFNKLNKNKNYKANSAGAIKGNPIDKLQKEVGKKYGITIKGSPQGLSSKLLKESDIIIVVANDVPANLFKDFKGHNKKLIIWNIPDVYSKNKIDIEKTILKIEKKVRDLIKKIKMKNKKGFEFSFAWIFAIIVGAVIIFIAIFAASQFIKTEKTTQDTKFGKQLGIILNPVETSLESSKTTLIILPIETRIFNECDKRGNFGTQKISTATKSSIGDEWQRPGFASSFHNKYLFSDDVIEGKSFIAFSKPFKMPFKVADLIYLIPTNKEYCFVNPPNDISEEIEDLQFPNINITNSKQRECINVCFNSPSSDCEIVVSTEAKTVRKKFQNTVKYETSPLLFAAIFSTSEIYECQLSRLMKRTSELSSLYNQKSIFLTPKGCSSNLESELTLFADQTLSLNNSQQISSVFQKSESLRRNNDRLSCQLF